MILKAQINSSIRNQDNYTTVDPVQSWLSIRPGQFYAKSNFFENSLSNATIKCQLDVTSQCVYRLSGVKGHDATLLVWYHSSRASTL